MGLSVKAEISINCMDDTLMLGIRRYLKSNVDTDRFYYSGYITGIIIIYTDLGLFEWPSCDFNFRDAFRGD